MTPAFSAENTPLELGTTLIQASAGTGKTYTITALFLRLLLEEKLEVRQILVTTYTEAATAELRERIRERLIAATNGFIAQESGDPVITALLQRVDMEEGLRLLTRAMRELDQAVVVTIHSFCQRVLRELAFESGLLFDVELVVDRRPLLQEVTEDFWRRNIANASPVLASAAASSGISLASLLELFETTAHRPFLVLEPEVPPGSFEALQQESRELFERLCHSWCSCSADLRRALLDEPRWSSKAARVGKQHLIDTWFADLALCLKSAGAAARDLSVLDELTTAALKRATLKGKVTPCHEFFDLCDEWQALKEKVPVIIKTEFIHWSRAELERRKLQQNVLHFDDLLTRLHSELYGDGGEALTTLLRGRFRAALIDEFQDTDEVQEEIFRRIFTGPESRLYLIGDPKQAIYGFRGADVYAYLKAAQIVDRRYTLGTNWRSEKRLVDGVSELFRRNPSAFLENGIALDDVAAAGERDNSPLKIRGELEPPLKLWTWAATEPLKNGWINEEIPGVVAAAVARLLASDATIGDAPLRPDQIAILVGWNRDARQVQDALNALGIPSVLISEESVWHTAEASELQIVLSAIAECWREPQVRAALATELLGFTASEIDLLCANESAWDAQLSRFASYHAQWCEHGFIQMFRTLLRDEKVRTRLLGFVDGDRRLTNLFHLSELLQRAATDLRLRPQAALRWFSEQRARPENGSNESTVLRLERDDDAVQIVTVHRSKGLEFEVVFCPYLWRGMDRRKDGKPLLFHSPDSRHLTLALDNQGPDAEIRREMTCRERLSENVRLAYVALTRAMHQCHMYWDRVAGGEVSGPSWLLHGNPTETFGLPGSLRDKMQNISAEDFTGDLSILRDRVPDKIELRNVEDSLGTPPDQRAKQKKAEKRQRARSFHAPIDRAWRVASFSSLIAGAFSEVPDYDDTRATADGVSDPALEAIHQFPAGARTGVCFHTILQFMNFSDFAGLQELVVRQLQIASFSPERWADTVSACLRRTMEVPLRDGFCLGNLSPAHRLNELEFYLPVENLDRGTLQALLEREDVEKLQFDQCRGWLKGFIDLVFQQAGKFYIVDWKSNHLGPSAADYDQPALAKVMVSHHYNLQLRLYTVALHRYLRLRVPGYDYDRHFGGAFYIFLRGADPTHPERGVYFERPERERIAAFNDTLGEIP